MASGRCRGRSRNTSWIELSFNTLLPAPAQHPSPPDATLHHPTIASENVALTPYSPHGSVRHDSAGLRGAMFDRYDPRDDDGRSRGDSFERHRGSRGSSDRDDDGRSAFGRHVDLPRGPDRELVRDRKRSYELNGQESEALATIGAFRVVHADDLRDVFDGDRDPKPARQGLRHLQESGLLERIPLESRDRDVVVLTGRGRDVLEANRLERDQRAPADVLRRPPEAARADPRRPGLSRLPARRGAPPCPRRTRPARRPRLRVEA